MASAAWIRGGDRRSNTVHGFRTVFDGEPGADAALRISAVNRYRVWLNGTLLGEGPPPSTSAFAYADTYAVGAHLRKKGNVLAVLVHFTGRNVGDEPGLWADLRSADGRILTATSEDWEGFVSDAWTADTFFFRMNWLDPWQEHFDSRRFPDGWETDPGPPRAAASLCPAPPVKELRERPIPLLRKEIVRPRRVCRTEECTWLDNRIRAEDLSITLSRPGVRVRRSRVERPDALTGREAGPCLLQCSREPLDDPDAGSVMEPFLTLDFGRQVNGCLEIDVEGPAGSLLDFGFAEQLVDGRFNNAIEAPLAARLVLRGGRQTWRMFTWRSWRYLRVRASRAFDPIRLHDLTAIAESLPMPARGKLRIGDRELQSVYTMCRRTVAMGAGETFFDSPWREQGQWLGDVAAVALDAHTALTGDPRLPSKFLYESAITQNREGLLANLPNNALNGGMSGTPLADYSLHWVRALRRFVWHTGSRDHLQTHLPVVRRLLKSLADRIDDRALLPSLPGWALIDWAPVCVDGYSAPFHALYVDALRHGAALAAEAGDGLFESWCLETRKALGASFHRAFWDGARGRYADGIVDGVRQEGASEHANALAILAGIAGANETAAIVRSVFESRPEDVVEAQPFFTSTVLEALDAAGRFDLALRFLKERWGRRMVDKGFATAGEEWTEGGSRRSGRFEGFLRSRSHIWSASPTHFLPTALMGLRILEPGGTRIELAPKATAFPYRVVYPLATGLLKVCWDGRALSGHGPKDTAIHWNTNLHVKS
jgi:alpha-L-rhamnosidase